jgi:uncharacterized membrane protein YebE (DUF533 family)
MESSMFDPERLLGQLMGDALSGQFGGRKKKSRHGAFGGLSTGTKAKLGLGLLGVAVAAYQHYQSTSGTGATPRAHAGTGTPPPPPGATPPPPPGANAVAATVPPPPPLAAPTPARSEHAMLLLRAMITAADADGLIDADERAAILGRARDAGIDEETLEQLDMEIRAPLTLTQLAVRTPPELREEVYVAALVAITADTVAERAFLDELAARIGLAAADRASLHARFGLDAA